MPYSAYSEPDRVPLARARRPGIVTPVAVFRFVSEDWSPWIALLHMRERWAELRCTMKVSYLQMRN